MEGEPAVGLDALLAHREWVRDLARHLVADRAAAEDLEQQAWLEAMTHPPRHAGALRAWFGRVLRRRASDARREGWRRARREGTAARPEAGRPTAEVVAEAEAHRRVVDAVLSLEEPYRETVLLRFFEDLPPRAVAARQSIPVETVRTRTRRALERLRARLDERSGGDRGAWVAALVPLAGVRWGTGAVTGGALMAGKAAVGVAVGCAVLGGVVGGIAARVAPGGRGAGPELAAARAEIRELRGRLDAIEARPASSPGVTTPGGERVASLQRRVDALESSAAAPRPAATTETVGTEKTPPVPAESVVAREVREKQARESLAALEKAKEAMAALDADVIQLRRRALDRSLDDEERIRALQKLRFLPNGIDQEVILGMASFFREPAKVATRDALLRELHSAFAPELKVLFLEALRSDPDERVRERAARDIDTYLEDPAVVQALEAARDGDSSAKVRESAAKTLDSRKKENWK